MDGTPVLVTPPAQEPVTLADVKAWARVATSADDALLTAILTAARLHVEQIAGLALLTQTWDYWLDMFPYGGLSPLRWTYGSPYAASVPRWTYAFPSGEIALPYAPLQTVSFVKYVDDTGATATLDPSLYQVDATRLPGRIVPAYGQTWPVARSQPNAVQVEYVAGYGAASTNVPEPLKQAIKVLAATMYEQREATVEAVLQDVPLVFLQLVNAYRVWWL